MVSSWKTPCPRTPCPLFITQERTGVVLKADRCSSLRQTACRFLEPSHEKLWACISFFRNRCMRRSTGLVGRYGAQTSLAACDRRAKPALTGSCPDTSLLTSHAGGSVAQRQRVFCRQNNPIIPSARVTGGKLVAVRAVCGAAKKCLAIAALGSSAAAQQRSSTRASGSNGES